MRLDKFLKVSRILKRRSVAKEACDFSRVLVNGREAKPAKEVKVGDEITIQFGDKTFSAVIVSLAASTKKEDAKNMYEIKEA